MTTTEITAGSSDGSDTPAASAQRIYVGIDIGYKTHVAAAIALATFNVHKYQDQWKRGKVISFSSDASGFRQLQKYLDGFSTNPADFLMLLEPTGGYYSMGMLMHLLGKGYTVMQVENTAVKEYREKIYGSVTKTDVVDARVMARMGFLHQIVGEEFSIKPVYITNPDDAALKVMVRDLARLQKEIVRLRNQLQQVVALTFPELKAFFLNGTAIPTARALLEKYPTPYALSHANVDEVTQLLRNAGAYRHAKRVDELMSLAETSVGLPMMVTHQWRQGWLLGQLNGAEKSRLELIEHLRQSVATHPYTPIIESLPIKSPIWTATLIAVIGNIERFKNYGDFKAYMGWSPQQAQSGTSLNSSHLSNKGVRLSRNVLGQMATLMLTPNIRDNPFREVYKRLITRERDALKPQVAQGHVAGKLSMVLYGMLKTMTPYDEGKHRRDMGLPEVAKSALTPVEVTDEVSELLDALDLDSAGTVDPSSNGHFPSEN